MYVFIVAAIALVVITALCLAYHGFMIKDIFEVGEDMNRYSEENDYEIFFGYNYIPFIMSILMLIFSVFFLLFVIRESRVVIYSRYPSRYYPSQRPMRYPPAPATGRTPPPPPEPPSTYSRYGYNKGYEYFGPVFGGEYARKEPFCTSCGGRMECSEYGNYCSRCGRYSG